jgi:hypothetical protein
LKSEDGEEKNAKVKGKKKKTNKMKDKPAEEKDESGNSDFHIEAVIISTDFFKTCFQSRDI